MSLGTDDETVVSVAVATLWTSPERVRPVDEPALRAPAEHRAWVAAMTDADRDDLDGRAASQLLLGDVVQVEAERDGWARVTVVSQPVAGRDGRGYPGWLPTAQLTRWRRPAGAAYVVDATATTLRDAPNGDVVTSGVILGTRLTAVGQVERGWVPVAVPDRDEPLWARRYDLAVAAHPADVTEPDVLGVAARLLDVPYMWGGVSAYGIDCSGLVHLTYRRFGVVVPRDAADQAEATVEVPTGTERPGDLYFFAHPGRPIHHVGLVAGEARLLHACHRSRRVVLEAIPPDRAATLVSVRRVARSSTTSR